MDVSYQILLCVSQGRDDNCTIVPTNFQASLVDLCSVCLNLNSVRVTLSVTIQPRLRL